MNKMLKMKNCAHFIDSLWELIGTSNFNIKRFEVILKVLVILSNPFHCLRSLISLFLDEWQFKMGC